MNVLLTSLGRRSYLVHYFRHALGETGKVLGVNMFPDSAGMQVADVAIVAPPAYSDEYVPFMLDVCKNYDVGLLCSLHDLDVYVLSQSRSLFERTGVLTTLPTAEWGRIALDKYECTQVLQRAGINTPWTTFDLSEAVSKLQTGELSYPLVLRARFGFGSLGFHVCYNEAELSKAHENARREIIASGIDHYIECIKEDSVLIQQALAGREVSLSVVNDFAGRYCAHFACEVHSMRSGESDWATSLDCEPFASFAQRLSQLAQHCSIWGFDCIDDNGSLSVIDVNPRFAGDYPFHHLAGADIPSALLAWAKGEAFDHQWLTTSSGIKAYKDIVPRIAGKSI